MPDNIQTIKDLYAYFAAGETERIRAVFAEDIEWIQMEGFPNGGRHVGADQIITNVFQVFRAEWSHWKADVSEYLDAGDSVLAVGQYHGTYRATGRSMTADFIHRYQLREGKVIRFTQYTDTLMVARAMGLIPD